MLQEKVTTKNFNDLVCHNQQKTVSRPVFMNPGNWLIACRCCSIFKCALALSTAFINTHSAEITGGHAEAEHGEAVYMECD